MKPTIIADNQTDIHAALRRLGDDAGYATVVHAPGTGVFADARQRVGRVVKMTRPLEALAALGNDYYFASIPPIDQDAKRRPYPTGNLHQADVLLLHPHPHGSTPGWWETRGKLTVDLLEDAGISAISVVSRPTPSTLIETLETVQPKVVINHSLMVRADLIEEFSQAYPDTKFISVCNGSHADLIRSETWMALQERHLQLADERRGCYYAVVDERNQLERAAKINRCIWLPNVVHLPKGWSLPEAKGRKAWIISLCCRYRVLKNVPNQIIALGLLNNTYPVQAIYCLPKAPEAQIDSLSKLCDVHYQTAEWSEWDQYQDLIRSVDVGLQVSFTESFNYVGIEHLAQGRPVIGSPAIRYLPEDWQASPDDPDSIANALESVFSDLPSASIRARAKAEEIARRNNTLFVERLKELLSDK